MDDIAQPSVWVHMTYEICELGPSLICVLTEYFGRGPEVHLRNSEQSVATNLFNDGPGGGFDCPGNPFWKLNSQLFAPRIQPPDKLVPGQN